MKAQLLRLAFSTAALRAIARMRPARGNSPAHGRNARKKAGSPAAETVLVKIQWLPVSVLVANGC